MLTELVLEASAHRSPRILSSGGLSGRLTGPDTVHMIGTAATPLGGDLMNIRVVVGPGARLVVRSVAASVALPSASERESSAHWSFEVDDDGVLDFDPEPMIVAADAVHHTTTLIAFSSSSKMSFRERVQIGRAGENLGMWTGTMRSDVDGRAHLRHRVELGIGTTGHDALARPMALSSVLKYPDSGGVDSFGVDAVRLPLAAGGSLTTCTGGNVNALPWST
jgi:urease accessory protein